MNTIFKIKKKTFVNGSLFSCKSCKSYNPAPASICRIYKQDLRAQTTGGGFEGHPS